MKASSLLTLVSILFIFSSCKLIGTDTGNSVDADTQEDFEAVIEVANDSTEEAYYGLSASSSEDLVSASDAPVLQSMIDRGALFKTSYRSVAFQNPSCPVTTSTGTSISFTATRSFDSCRPFQRDLVFDGTESLSLTRTLADVADDAIFDRSGVFERSLSLTSSKLRRRIEVESGFEFENVGTWPNLNVTQSNISVQRKRYRTSDDRLFRDYAISGALESEFSGADTVTAIQTSGDLEVIRNLIEVTTSVNLQDLRYEAGCLCPVSGSVVKTVIAGENSGQVRRFVFSACGVGKMTQDGVEGQKSFEVSQCSDSD